MKNKNIDEFQLQNLPFRSRPIVLNYELKGPLL